MRVGLSAWLVLGMWLTGCGGWPYGDPSALEGTRPLAAELELEQPEPGPATCSQERLPVALDAETALGTAADVVRWVEGFHTGNLVWSANGNRTQITIDVWDVRAFSVSARRRGNSNNVSNSDVRCASYLELVVQAELASGDGRIFHGSELTLRVYGGIEAFATLYIAWDVLGDAYRAPNVTGRCFQGLHVKLLLGDSGFSGSLSHDFTQGHCDTTSDVHVSAPAGHWGPRWQSY